MRNSLLPQAKNLLTIVAEKFTKTNITIEISSNREFEEEIKKDGFLFSIKENGMSYYSPNPLCKITLFKNNHEVIIQKSFFTLFQLFRQKELNVEFIYKGNCQFNRDLILNMEKKEDVDIINYFLEEKRDITELWPQEKERLQFEGVEFDREDEGRCEIRYSILRIKKIRDPSNIFIPSWNMIILGSIYGKEKKRLIEKGFTPIKDSYNEKFIIQGNLDSIVKLIGEVKLLLELPKKQSINQ